MPRTPKVEAAEKPAARPATRAKPAAKEEAPEPAQRPSQTQQSSAEGRVVEGSVPKIELFKPEKISDTELAKLNVHQRWNRCIGEIGLVPKRGWNDHHGYWFTTDADLNAFIGPLFHKYHLLVVPTVILDKVERIELAGKQTLTRVPMHISVINADKPEDRFEVDWMGEGGDTVDKGAYKAFTGGLKYFYMKLLQVSTGDDPEVFTKTDQLGDLAARDAAQGGGQPARPVAIRPSNARQPEKGGHQQNPTDVQVRQVRALSRALSYGVRGTAETFDRVLGSKIFDTIDQMESDEEASRVLAEWIKKLTGTDVGKVLHEMGEEVAKREREKAEPKPDEQPSPPDETVAVESEEALLAEAAEGQEDLGLEAEAEGNSSGY